MYNNLLAESPNLIFIFLGANDTKCSSASDYNTPLVSPSVQNEYYQKLIEYFQEKNDAEIIIIETPAFNSIRCEELAKALHKKGGIHNKFGIRKAIKDFNCVNKSIAQEYGLKYIPLFDETVNHPQRERLFQPADGIHLTPMGNRVIAKEILKMFTKMYPKK
jgi:lysophospholipase L1-like esterase